MTDREALAAAFISEHGWSDAERKTIAGDASNRRYDRLRRSSGDTVILMDAPPDRGEDIRPFVSIAAYLRSIDLSSPKIFAQDENHGFLLIEDLGDSIFARVIEAQPELETRLYEAAIDVLTALHAHKAPDVETYGADLMTNLAALSFDWYQKAAIGSVDTVARSEFCENFRQLLDPLQTGPLVLIQRDYHAENLLWLPDRIGPARVGLLDFQDAMRGHPAYDLVSILHDARRDVTPALQDQMIKRYLAQNLHLSEGFEEAFALLGVQRNLRIIGVFARLCIRDGKAHYLEMIPRVWGHVQKSLKNPALEPVSALIQKALPVPTDAILRKLRSKCLTNPLP